MGSASLYCRSYAVAKKNYSSTIHLEIFIAFCILHETVFCRIPYDDNVFSI